MCTIDKMLVKGIRSFPPENTSAIEFFRPLTLIVGPNGAGKTTIIESLRAACTGELPTKTGQARRAVFAPSQKLLAEEGRCPRVIKNLFQKLA